MAGCSSSAHWDATTEIEESDDPEAAFAAVTETAHEFGDVVNYLWATSGGSTIRRRSLWVDAANEDVGAARHVKLYGGGALQWREYRAARTTQARTQAARRPGGIEALPPTGSARASA